MMSKTTTVNQTIYCFFDSLNGFMISIRDRLAYSLHLPADWLRQIWLTRVSLVSVLVGMLVMLTTQARDLLSDQSATLDVQITFYCFILLFWAVPVHYTARMALDRYDPSRDVPFSFTRFWPRCLGLSTIAIICYASFLAVSDLHNIIGLEEAVSASHRIRQTYWSVFGAVALFIAYAIFHRWGANINKDIIRRRSTLPNWTETLTVWDTIWSALPLGYAVITISLFFWAVFDPSSFASRLHRLFLLPVVLGGWLPIAGYLATISNNARFPVLSILLIAIIVIGSFAKHHNDVRVIPVGSTLSATSQRQSVLRDAIHHWKMVNCGPSGCLNCEVSSCPRPILIAAEGGASRAAFHAATVIGALLDATSGDLRYRDVRSSIFAMSGVSGGALGVGTVRAALDDALREGKVGPPCKQSSDLWFLWGNERQHAGASPKERKWTWRDCLQVLTSGDYLSPAFVGLAFRDWLAPPLGPSEYNAKIGARGAYLDRSALLEQSMERHYNNVVFLDSDRACGPAGASEGEDKGIDERGLCKRFGYLQNQREDEHEPWLPVLLLNSTTVERGRPLITSDIFLSCPAIAPRAKFKDLFPTTLDFFELLNSRIEQVNPQAIEERKNEEEEANCDGVAANKIRSAGDIRLSTAIVNSARFPLISTQGNITNDGGRSVAVRIVDGGYFDSSGLTTLQPIISDLQREGLRPIVVRLSNDPVHLDEAEIRLPPPRKELTGPNVVPEPQGFWSWLLDRYTSPLDALNNTREGHEEAARVATFEMVTSFDPKIPSYFPILMYDKIDMKGKDSKWCRNNNNEPINMSRVSMSWWLSPVTQGFIDLQLCGDDNVRYLNCLLDQLLIDIQKVSQSCAEIPDMQSRLLKAPLELNVR